MRFTRQNSIVFLFTLFSLLCLNAASIVAQSLSNWEKDLITSRQAKDLELSDPQESPLEKEDVNHFKGLPYFPPDSTFVVEATLIETPDSGWFEMPTSTNRRPLYRIYGWLHFTIQGKTVQLAVYQNKDLLKKEGLEDYLFLPFADLTNGEETYGGGRYLELRIPLNSNQLSMDFNKAYNPYCAYSNRFSCPLVPSVNHLPVAVVAGELDYPGGKH